MKIRILMILLLAGCTSNEKINTAIIVAAELAELKIYYECLKQNKHLEAYEARMKKADPDYIGACDLPVSD